MSEETKRIVEIRGVKMEVDLETAKRIDIFKVGQPVNVLKKKWDDYKVYHGVVIGFEPFENHPTILIAYIEDDYSDIKMQMLYYNDSTDKETEVVAAAESDKMSLSKGEVLKHFGRQESVKQKELDEIKAQRDYFLEKFGVYFEDMVESETA